MHNSTPELFRTHVRQALRMVKSQDPEHRLVFVKAWNEWAEGNYLEPDEKFGRGYLEVLREEISCGVDASGEVFEPAEGIDPPNNSRPLM